MIYLILGLLGRELMKVLFLGLFLLKIFLVTFLLIYRCSGSGFLLPKIVTYPFSKTKPYDCPQARFLIKADFADMLMTTTLVLLLHLSGYI